MENQQPDETYARALAGEGEYWDNFIAQRLLRGEMPGSVDWRLNFTQFRYNHGWRPLALGPAGINFRMSEIRYLLTTAVPRPGVRVLDLGCGAGWLSLELARQGAHVTALDISPTNLALGRYMAETNARNFPYLYQRFAGLPCDLTRFGTVNYRFADLNTVTLPEREFDAVVVWDSLHHVAEIERLLEQVRRSLKPGGLFVGVDHAFATARTLAFNGAVGPWVRDFYTDWASKEGSRWLYAETDRVARGLDWGAMAVDYDDTPVPGFGDFSKQLFAEMLDILKSSLREEALEKARKQSADPVKPTEEEESPFEDVSARRLMRVLYESFDVQRFETICPFIRPDELFPHYHDEAERLFLHYLSATLLKMGEQAIERGQANGQWFIFSLTPQRPDDQVLPEWLEKFGRDTLGQLFDELQADSARKNDYINRLESDLAAKNASLASLEAQVRQREAELVEARKPRLPWKR